MTNYEKIKSMTVDEMGKFFEDNFVFPCYLCHSDCSSFEDSGKCYKTLKNWLKAESEED